jgi:hypothetical protein
MGGRLFPNARGVHSFLACRDPPANIVRSLWTTEAKEANHSGARFHGRACVRYKLM